MKIHYQIDEFVESCVARGLSKKTYRSYEQTLVLFAKYLEEHCNITEASEVTTKTISDYMEYIRQRGKYTVQCYNLSVHSNFPENRQDYGKKVSDVTINNYIRNIKVFFAYLHEYGYIKVNPAKKVKSIKVPRKPLKYITDSEFRRLTNSMDISKLHEYRDYTIINTLIDTGMRIGECLLLKVEDIDFNDKIITLHASNTKGKKSRYVFFSVKLAHELKRWLKYKDRYLETNLLFPTNRGTLMQVSNFERNLRGYAARVDIKDVHPHCFRNNFAKRFLMSGGDIYTLSRILGHSSVSVTEAEYLDLDVMDLKKQYMQHSPLCNMKRQ